MALISTMFLYDVLNETKLNLNQEKKDLNVNWNRNLVLSKNLSLINYIENNPYRIKKKYLSFIHNLGNQKVSKKSLSNLLVDKKGYNLWWMSLLAEKSNYKSAEIINCLKLIALEEIILKKKIKKITFVSDNKKLSHAIQLLCNSKSISFEFNKISNTKNLAEFGSLKLSISKIYYLLPIFIQSFVWLINFYFTHLNLKFNKVEKNYLINQKSEFLFISNFAHLNLEKIKKNIFFSYQWGDLNILLKKLKINSLWLHNYIKSQETKNSSKAKRYIKMINNKQNYEKHLFLTSYVNLKIILFAATKLLYYFLYSPFIFRHIKRLKFESYNSASMIYLLTNDLKKSLYGNVLVENLIYIEFFDQILKKIKKKKIGFFLMENQPWERAFIHAWRKYNHGKLIGYCHTTVNYWHLNYFDDVKTLNSFSKYSRKKPDLVAVSGSLAKNNLLKFGYQKSQILEVESLRYAYLGRFRKRNKNIGKKDKILLLGDYEDATTANMLNCFGNLDNSLKKKFKFHFKPYPAKQQKDGNTKIKFLSKINKPLQKIIKDYFIIMTSRSTAAALEAHAIGKNVIIFLEKNEINSSPLFGVKKINYVNNENELKKIIFRILKNKKNKLINNYFYVNLNLEKWKKTLNRFKNSKLNLV